MSSAQKAALIALPVLVAAMYGVYALAGALFGASAAWYIGFLVYWPVWCLAFPRFLVGWRGLRHMFAPARMTPLLWALTAAPPLFAWAGRIMGTKGSGEPWLWIPTTILNGALEEVLWRGVFLVLFPLSLRWGLLWPSLWFALWHLAPGSISYGANPAALVAAALPLGLLYAWVARQSGSIRWTAASHVMAGLALA